VSEWEEGRSELAGGIWTNSTRPPRRRQPSQFRMTLLAAPALDTRLHWTRSKATRPAATVRPDVDAATRAWSHPWNGRAALTRHSGYGLPTGRTRTVAHGTEKEQPFVVMRTRSLVDLERRFLAFAANSHHTAGSLTTEGRRLRSCRRGAGTRWWSTQAGRRRTAAPASPRLLRRRPSLPGHATRRIDDVPLAALIHGQRRVVLRHRVFVLLSDKPVLNQDVEARRIAGSAHFSHVEIDAARNLFAAENEFRFLLALRLRLPDGHGDGHEHHHDRQADKQRRHGVASLVALTTL